jgi:hypothetical protein
MENQIYSISHIPLIDLESVLTDWQKANIIVKYNIRESVANREQGTSIDEIFIELEDKGIQNGNGKTFVTYDRIRQIYYKSKQQEIRYCSEISNHT